MELHAVGLVCWLSSVLQEVEVLHRVLCFFPPHHVTQLALDLSSSDEE